MQFIRSRFEAAGLVTDHGPIVGVNENAANPHYEPTEQASRGIERGDLFLIDMWAKLDQPRSVYYDITWTGFCGPQVRPPSGARIRCRAGGARTGRSAACSRRLQKGEPLRGFEVDDAARGYIKQQGFGDHFVHRTGHSIGEEVHGAGANMDNLETHDERRVIPWTCFSIEPGIYLQDFGIRLEVNVFVGEKEAHRDGRDAAGVGPCLARASCSVALAALMLPLPRLRPAGTDAFDLTDGQAMAGLDQPLVFPILPRVGRAEVRTAAEVQAATRCRSPGPRRRRRSGLDHDVLQNGDR